MLPDVLANQFSFAPGLCFQSVSVACTARTLWVRGLARCHSGGLAYRLGMVFHARKNIGSFPVYTYCLHRWHKGLIIGVYAFFTALGSPDLMAVCHMIHRVLHCPRQPDLLAHPVIVELSHLIPQTWQVFLASGLHQGDLSQ